MNTQTQDNVRAQLIYDLGLSDIPVEKQEELLVKMMEVVLKRIFVETMARLNDADKEMYMSMIEKNMTPEEVEAYVQDKIPRYNELVAEITRQLRDEMTNA